VVNVVIQLYPVVPAAGIEERIQLRPIGRNAERYHEAIHGTLEIVQAAEAMGVWGAACIEHHFWSEGYEVGPSPGVVNAFWAARTEKIHVGALGYVMTTQNPIRVAEETAVLDHLANGRYFVGLARGYQARWAQVMGQHYGARATTAPEGEDNAINRQIFEEHVDLLLKAWTQDSIEHQSPHWQVPFPHDQGINWPMWPATERLGAPGEVVDGYIRRVSVVPSPYQKPHPPIFVPTSRSMQTVEWCAEHGFIPTHFTHIDRAEECAHRYVEVSRAAGRPVPLGKNQMLTRWIYTGETMAEARHHFAKYAVELFRTLHLLTGKVPPGRDPADFARNATDDEWIEQLLKSGLFIVGTPDDVKRQFIEQWTRLPAEYACFIFHYALHPKDEVLRELQQFMNQVKPELDSLTERAWQQSTTSDGRLVVRQ
jgi:alkanesulfonate monooxygenase SsuD/methylene tetrahydromethanopterin reductase-like flavin-dependent oxidoreductase (luciferase family)